MIDNKFLFFKNRATFEDKLRRNEINRRESIVFIQGETLADRAIWTHGVYYEPHNGLEHSKGFFDSYEALHNACPWPEIGDWAIVAKESSPWVFGNQLPVIFSDGLDGDWVIYTCDQNGQWKETCRKYNKERMSLVEYLKAEDIVQIQEDILDIKSAMNEFNAAVDDVDYMYFTFLTLEQYDALSEHNEDTLYFIKQNLL